MKETEFSQSIVRRGNHFIKLFPPSHKHGQWLLIDGPWFDLLEDHDVSYLLLSRYLRYKHFEREPDICIDRIGSYELYWERYIIPLTFFGKVTHRRHYHYYLKLAERYSTVQYCPSDSLLRKYSAITAWICNDGILPVDIRLDVWDEDLLDMIEGLS